jgi:hypothetical protein
MNRWGRAHASDFAAVLYTGGCCHIRIIGYLVDHKLGVYEVERTQAFDTGWLLRENLPPGVLVMIDPVFD